MLEHRIRPTVKPDLDNVAKLIYDALNGVAWYDDNAYCRYVRCESSILIHQGWTYSSGQWNRFSNKT